MIGETWCVCGGGEESLLERDLQELQAGALGRGWGDERGASVVGGRIMGRLHHGMMGVATSHGHVMPGDTIARAGFLVCVRWLRWWSVAGRRCGVDRARLPGLCSDGGRELGLPGGTRHTRAGPLEGLPATLHELRLSAEQREGREAVFEGEVSEGNSATVGHVITTRGGPEGARQTIRYSTDRVVGNGSFGVVYGARCVETGETVAIKKVLQDRRFKNRELQIVRTLSHPNIVALKHCFHTPGEHDDVYLNLVLEYVPDTVYRINKHYTRNEQRMPLILVRLYAYQMLRALAHIHARGICHRDIKPQNLLVDINTHALKLCDFGSAKALVRGEPNISYICSRYYRAPELIFGATDYTVAIDVWSVGCVIAELLLGSPLFPGESGVDQLVEIIKVRVREGLGRWCRVCGGGVCWLGGEVVVWGGGGGGRGGRERGRREEGTGERGRRSDGWCRRGVQAADRGRAWMLLVAGV